MQTAQLIYHDIKMTVTDCACERVAMRRVGPYMWVNSFKCEGFKGFPSPLMEQFFTVEVHVRVYMLPFLQGFF